MIDFDSMVNAVVPQIPLVAAAIGVAKHYLTKHEELVQKLVSTFESEIKACEDRYAMVFSELMKLKDKVG
jgi:hypothetical protein